MPSISMFCGLIVYMYFVDNKQSAGTSNPRGAFHALDYGKLNTNSIVR